MKGGVYRMLTPARRKQAVYRQGRRQAQGLVHVRLG